MVEHSDNYLAVKKHYFEEKYPVKEVKLEFRNSGENPAIISRITFDVNGADYVIEGAEPDFVEACCKFQSTIRDGKNKLVDISTTPAHDTNTYYQNMESFILKGDVDIKVLCSQLEEGKGNIDVEVDVKEGMIAILKKDFSQKNAKEILANYFESIALVIVRMKPLYFAYETSQKRLVKHLPRFKAYMSQVDNIFKSAFTGTSSIQPLLTMNRKCNADLAFLLQKAMDVYKLIDSRWKLLYQATGGKMEGKQAMQMIVDDYSKFFEIIIDPLRDLATLLKLPDDEFELTSEEQIINFLKKKGHADLVGTIDNVLRNADSHVSIDYSEKGKLKIYDKRHKTRNLLKELTYQQVLEKFEKISDLTLAIIFEYLMTLEVYYLRALDSPEFKFFVVENKPPVKQT